MQATHEEAIEIYFCSLFESGWVGVESLLTNGQIENAVTIDFVNGIFVASALACIEDDHTSDRPVIMAKRELIYQQFGGLQGVIGELIRRMEFDWCYVSVDQRTAADWVTPDLNRVRMR